MNTARITYCEPAKAAGHCLDDIIAFLRAGCPLSTARLLANAYSHPCSMSDKTWERFRKYTERIAEEGVWDFQV